MVSDNAEKEGVPQEVGASDFPNRLERASGAFSKQVVPKQLEDIQGEHALVKGLEKTLKRLPIPLPGSEYMPPSVVLRLLDRMPILLTKENNTLYCIGNVRVYRLANCTLDRKELVPTLQYSGSLTSKRREQLVQGLLVEMFLLPSIFARRANDLQVLNSAWQKAKDAKLLDFWGGAESFSVLCGETPAIPKRKRGLPHG